MKNIRSKILHIVPPYGYLPLTITVVFNMLVYFGSKLIASNWHHYNFETFLDKQIPLLSWSLAVYSAAYIFWSINYILCVRISPSHACRFLSADLLAKGVCFFFYLALPTTNTRPEITGSGFFNIAMSFLYQIDSADNLFPSIHCLVSQFCFIGVRNRKEIPKWYQVLSLFIDFAICVSTLTTKQHVILDVIGGILLAEFCFWYTGHSSLADRYGACFMYFRKHIKYDR